MDFLIFFYIQYICLLLLVYTPLTSLWCFSDTFLLNEWAFSSLVELPGQGWLKYIDLMCPSSRLKVVRSQMTAAWQVVGHARQQKWVISPVDPALDTGDRPLSWCLSPQKWVISPVDPALDTGDRPLSWCLSPQKWVISPVDPALDTEDRPLSWCLSPQKWVISPVDPALDTEDRPLSWCLSPQKP